MRVLRISQITIEMPDPGDLPWIMATLQSVTLDEAGQVISASPREDLEHANVQEIAAKMIAFQDPVTGQALEVSGAGLQAAVHAMTLSFVAQARDLSITADGYLTEAG